MAHINSKGKKVKNALTLELGQALKNGHMPALHNLLGRFMSKIKWE